MAIVSELQDICRKLCHRYLDFGASLSWLSRSLVIWGRRSLNGRKESQAFRQAMEECGYHVVVPASSTSASSSSARPPSSLDSCTTSHRYRCLQSCTLQPSNQGAREAESWLLQTVAAIKKQVGRHPRHCCRWLSIERLSVLQYGGPKTWASSFVVGLLESERAQLPSQALCTSAFTVTIVFSPIHTS